MNQCEITRVHHSLQDLKLNVAKLLNLLNRKGNPCAAIDQAPHDFITKQVVDTEMNKRVLQIDKDLPILKPKTKSNNGHAAVWKRNHNLTLIVPRKYGKC